MFGFDTRNRSVGRGKIQTPLVPGWRAARARIQATPFVGPTVMMSPDRLTGLSVETDQRLPVECLSQSEDSTSNRDETGIPLS